MTDDRRTEPAVPDEHGPSRPTAKSAETRARIVAGALRALETHGLGQTTTRRIAEESDIRLATLHYHFSSKEAVLLAVLEMMIDDMTATLTARTRSSDALDARIAYILRASWSYVEQTRAKQIVQYELTLYAVRTKGCEWLAARQYQAYVGAYVDLLSGGRASPELAAADAEDLARLMLAGIDGLILQSLAGASECDLRASVEALTVGVQARAARLSPRGARLKRIAAA
ncbi:TetR/AcrR family transcriptional regulator [Lichenihabitans psoromatis]|uniref:TetR/AcrR family transcriptional regulator n=1 Tax=Lichenihabitans psoromatis TaxID=2528642 RepID=UPI001035D7C0|nr:TetR/AcrR family transcriptional regulator [Lichenihabitans psoromatis]